MTDTESQQQR